MRKLISLLSIVFAFSFSPLAVCWAKDDPPDLIHCEFLLLRRANAELGALRLHRMITDRNFKVYFAQGTSGLFKAFGLDEIDSKSFKNLHMNIQELSEKHARQLNEDYIVSFFYPKKKEPHFVSQLFFQADPLAARGVSHQSRQQFEASLKSEGLEFTDMEPDSLEDLMMTVRLKTKSRYRLYLSVTEQNGEIFAELGAYVLCSSLRNMNETNEYCQIRLPEGWRCAVPVLRFYSQGPSQPAPSSGIRYNSIERH